MSTKLYIVEGLPCSGKSTAAAYIAKLTGGKLFDEGSADHPADYEFSAFIPDSAGFTPEERRVMEEYAEPQPGGIVVKLSRLPGEIQSKALRYKIYDALDWETERPVMLRKWRSFAENAGDEVYVFNCVLLQNPMCETMMRFDFPPEKSLEYIKEISDIIRPLEPVVIYLKSTDAAGQIRAALPERGEEWLSAVTDYHCNGGYGRAHGLSGFEGYISALEERQRRELSFLKELPVKSVVLELPRSLDKAYRVLDETLRGEL